MKKSIATAVVFASVTACGGLGAGDYVVYRVASAEAQLSGDCANDPDSSSTLREGGTFVIYAVATEADDVFYLDTGDAVIEGAATDDGYAFAAKVVDVEGTGGNQITQTVEYSAAVTDKGDEVEGTFTTKSTLTTPNSSESCTSTVSFVGVELDDPSIDI